MKKITIGVSAIALLLSVNFAVAQTSSQGVPFSALWDAVDFLQGQIDNIALTPGPEGPQGPQGEQGEPGESWDEASFLELEARVTALEALHPSAIIVGANLDAYEKPAVEDCDISVPSEYPTIQAGINAAVDGDTVCVGPGTYNENAEWAISINKSIKLSGNGFIDSSIINYGSALYSSYAVYIDASNVTLEGFVINGLGESNPAVLIGADTGSNVTIQYNQITASDSSVALRSDSRSNNYLIQHNIFTGTNSPSILFLAGSSSLPFTVLNNTFLGTINEENGRALRHSSPTLVERNVFNATGASWVVDYGCSPETTDIHYNNFNADALIKVRTCAGGADAENNWWGDLDPSNDIAGTVDHIPFATEPFAQY